MRTTGAGTIRAPSSGAWTQSVIMKNGSVLESIILGSRTFYPRDREFRLRSVSGAVCSL